MKKLISTISDPRSLKEVVNKNRGTIVKRKHVFEAVISIRRAVSGLNDDE